MRRLRNIFYSLFLFALVAVIAQDAESRSRMRFRSGMPLGGWSNNGSARFDASGTANVDFGNLTPLDGAEYVTWSFWIKIDTWPATKAVWKRFGSSGQYQFYFRADAAGGMRVYIATTASAVSRCDIAASTFSNATWHHFVGRYDKDETGTDRFKTWVDQAAVACGSWSSSPPAALPTPSAIAMKLGESSSSIADANLDEVFLWVGASGTLSLADVQSLAPGGKPGDPDASNLGEPTLGWRFESDFTATYGSDDGTASGVTISTDVP